MGEQLKNRLAGAAVLLLLAGLAWPLLFDFDDSMRGADLDMDIPVMPEQARADIEATRAATAATGQPDEPSLTERISAEAEELLQTTKDNVAAATADTPAARTRPRLDQDHIPVSYVVQVATFNDWNNASNFRDSLQSSGFKAYASPPGPSQTGPYRIAVGPVLTYAEAEQIARRIEEEHRIMDAIIRRLRDV